MDTTGETRRVAELVRGLGPRDAVLFYPEGTRFTEAKRARLLEKLRAAEDPAAEEVESLTHVLPPRRGGSLAVLQGAPEADVVLAANVGFEWATSLSHLWRGDLVEKTIRLSVRRVPAGEVPRDDEGCRTWLQDEWRAMNEWVRTR